MTAFVDEMQLTVRDQLVEFLADERRRDRIIVAPDQQRGYLDLIDLFTQVVADGILCKRNDLYRLEPHIHRLVQFIHQLFGGHLRIIEGDLRLFADILVILSLWIGVSHPVLEKTGAAGEGKRPDTLRMTQYMHQRHMPA